MICAFSAQAVAFGQGVASLLPQLSALTEILPPPTLAWKLQLLQEGNRWPFFLPCLLHAWPVKTVHTKVQKLAGFFLLFTQA